MLINLITLHSLVISIVYGQSSSPCPEVFEYEPRNNRYQDRWDGVITVGTDEDLEGVWLKIVLDRKADLLGNWFADAESSDSTEFSIRNPHYKLAAGPPILVKFFVKYDTDRAVPLVKKILLNGRTICPTQQFMPTEPTLHISFAKPSSSESDEHSLENDNEHHSSSTRTSTKRPHSTSTRGPQKTNMQKPENKRPVGNTLSSSHSSEDKDDFFQGDFHGVTSKRPVGSTRPLNASSSSVQCGTVANRANPLISYGQETSPGQWPWHAALYLFTGTELKYICGGTLISDRHVVTAAHCVTKLRTNRVVQKDKFVVYLGKYNLISFAGEVQDRQIESIIVHPEYNSSLYFNDISILKLESPVDINNVVRPCCLWEERDTNIENIIGQKGTVVGWGLNEEGQLSKNLMQAQLPVVSTTTCLLSNRNFFSQFIFEKNFCAGFRNDTSVCNGDSGGGMVFPRRGTSGQNTVWQLRGVISVGVARQSGATCDPKQYSVLTDAAKYVNWIKGTMRD